MKKLQRFKRRITDYLYDHIIVKEILSHLKYLVLAIAAAFIFAVGFTSFITPNVDSFVIATGGVSGLSQIVAKIFELAGHPLSRNIIQGIGYTVFNVPLIIFSFIKIGKKFSIYSTFNVILTSLLVIWFSAEDGLADKIGMVTIGVNSLGDPVYLLDNIIARVLFAAVCTGVSSALAFVGDFSCGGIDIVTYYLGQKKSSQIGKYGVAINIVVVTVYSFLSILSNPSELWSQGLLSLLYSGVYLLVVAIVVDKINLRNKKVEVRIISKVENMGNILIAYFPHGATESRAQGVYTHNDEFIFSMIVTSNEYKKVVSVAKQIDPHCFVTVTTLVQVYGNFFSKPVE